MEAAMMIELLALLAVRAVPGHEIELWTREAGVYDRGAEPVTRQSTVDLGSRATVEAQLFDLQLGATHVFRGLNLSSLVESRGTGSADTMLLHFANGMVVPVQLERASAVFVAVAIRSPAGDWDRSFPEIQKRRAVLPDPRPIAFGANKVVVSDASETFSPWPYVDTLVGIELVRRAAYWAQFDVGAEPEIRRGMRVYLDRCHGCHAVRDVGGTFGWDLVDPVPVYSYRSPQTLFAHVKYDNADALERGYMMPAQKDIERPEIDAFLEWLKRAAKSGLNAYQP
jgi:mono/diheme cytochrome c family protein